MKGKKSKQQFLLDKFLVLLAIICIIFAGLIISMYLDNAEMSIFAKSGNQMKESYTSEGANEWDVSEAEDGSVIATLSDDGTLTISGTGNMANFYDESPWYSEKQLIKEIIIKEGITSIGDSAFVECNCVTNIEIPESVTMIGDWAFESCYMLKNIEIPSSVISIGPDAFYCCYMLQNIKVKEENTKYCDVDGVLYSKDKTEIIKYPIGKTQKEYTILNSVTSIGYSAFEECVYLMKIEIPENVTNIEDYAFGDCESLTSMEIPSSVTTIGNYTFDGCQITNLIALGNNEIEIPEILKSVQNETDVEFIVTNCTLENGKIKITDGEAYATIEVQNGSFDGLTYMISYNSWDISEESDKSLIATLDNNGVFTISGAGDMKEFSDIANLPWDNVEQLIRKAKIEEGVTKVQLNMFYYCHCLESIDVSSSITSLGEDLRSLLLALTEINVDINNSKYCDDNGVLYTKDKTTLLIYPMGREEGYYKILNGAKRIGFGAFLCATFLTDIEIPNTVIEIDSYAFGGCFYLKNVTIPKSVTTIGENAFDGRTAGILLCYEDSTAATYAQENDINYLIIMDEIQSKTTVQQIKQKMGSGAEYEITDKNGETIADDKHLSTGCKVEASNGENYIIIVEGDTNGDGNADIKDILAINKYRLNKSNLGAEYLLASDVNEDSVADIKDILQINKFRLGKTESL